MSILEEAQKQLSILPPEKQREALDFIEFLAEKTRSTQPVATDAERKERIRKAFAALAELKTFADIPDPIEWQRQIRKDRPLPGRNS